MITTRELDDWLRWLEPGEADRALLAAGLRFDELGAVHANTRLGLPEPVMGWTLSDEEFQHRRQVDPGALAELLRGVSGLRLAVTTGASPIGVLRRLLRVEAVASAFVAVARPPGSLRRRPWHWPLRVGLVGFPTDAADDVMATIRSGHKTLPNLLDVTRIEDEPGAVDVALIEGPLAAAAPRLVELKPVANAILVFDGPAERSPVIEGLLAAARAATGASASALIPLQDVAELLTCLVAEASHAEPFDVALTKAVNRELLLWAEPDAMMRADVPRVARRTARELGDARALAPARSGDFETAMNALAVAAEGEFRKEGFEATDIAGATRSIEPALDAVVEERWCQVGDGTLLCGSNEIRFFIGPLEEGAVAATAPLDESGLPFEEEDAAAFRLTILFVPAVKDAVAQQAELELPRFGRTDDAVFTLDVGFDEPEVAARILVLFRNRILQTAVLSGHFGEAPSLGEVVALVPSLNGLDDRRAFDLALFANHTAGRQTLTAHASGDTKVTSAGAVPAIGERIADVLSGAAVDRRSLKKGLSSAAARELLIALAVKGRALFKELRRELGAIPSSPRIQIVTARSSWLLPIEIVYEREAPDDDAVICANYLADPATCTGRCTLTPERRSVCPNAFWGLSKTIERYRYDADRDPVLFDGYQLVGAKRSRRGRRDLTVDRAVFGASRRVTPADNAATVAAVGHGAVAVADWDAWETELAAADTQLLVLLPHTDLKQGTIEIAGSALDGGRIERRHVTGNRDVDPIMILFGCRTTGTRSDPAGFASLFFQEDAGAVFHSSADLRNVHATELARRLIACLIRPGHQPRMLSEALVEFRSEAVRDGLVMALGISALGDADWRI